MVRNDGFYTIRLPADLIKPRHKFVLASVKGVSKIYHLFSIISVGNDFIISLWTLLSPMLIYGSFCREFYPWNSLWYLVKKKKWFCLEHLIFSLLLLAALFDCCKIEGAIWLFLGMLPSDHSFHTDSMHYFILILVRSYPFISFWCTCIFILRFSRTILRWAKLPSSLFYSMSCALRTGQRQFDRC